MVSILKSLLDGRRRHVVIILHNESHGIRLGCHFAYVRVLGVEIAEQDVFADRLIEEQRLLLNDRNIVSQVGNSNLLQVLPIDVDTSFCAVIESKKK